MPLFPILLVGLIIVPTSQSCQGIKLIFVSCREKCLAFWYRLNVCSPKILEVKIWHMVESSWMGLVLIFVHSSCYNKVPSTGWLRNNGCLFLTVLQAGVRDQRANLVTVWWDTLPGFRLPPSLYGHMAESGEEAGSLGALIKALLPFIRAAHSRPHLILITS